MDWISNSKPLAYGFQIDLKTQTISIIHNPLIHNQSILQILSQLSYTYCAIRHSVSSEHGNYRTFPSVKSCKYYILHDFIENITFYMISLLGLENCISSLLRCLLKPGWPSVQFEKDDIFLTMTQWAVTDM